MTITKDDLRDIRLDSKGEIMIQLENVLHSDKTKSLDKLKRASQSNFE